MALKQALQQVSASVRMSVRAVAVSGQQHGFVPIDGNGEVLHAVKLWCDTSTQQEADEIMEDCGGRERCIELAGNPGADRLHRPEDSLAAEASSAQVPKHGAGAAAARLPEFRHDGAAR